MQWMRLQSDGDDSHENRDAEHRPAHYKERGKDSSPEGQRPPIIALGLLRVRIG
jgi:hypothetical protein